MCPSMTWGDNSGDDYPGKIQDCMLYNATPDTNYNDFPLYLGCFNYPNKFYRSMIGFNIKADLESLGASSVISAKLYLYPTEINGSHNVSAYRVVQGWLEDECTFNSFKTGSSWHTSGCASASDAAIDDDLSYDRFATPEDTKVLSGTGSYSLVLDLTSLAQKWFSGDNKEYGVLLKSDNEAVNTRCVLSGITNPDGQRPYLEVDFTIPAAKLSGTIKEIGASVVRTVRCYTRSTGVLYASGASNPDGSFELDAPDDTTEMFVVSFPDGNGEKYNALILDRVKGVLS